MPSGGEREAVGRGDQETHLPLCVLGKINGTEREVILRLPTLIYEAKINDDLILSYAWCRQWVCQINPRQHAIFVVKKGQNIFVEGIRTTELLGHTTVVQVAVETPPKLALDLFSGTGSTTRVLEGYGYTVTTLDNDPRYRPTICGSILEWEYKAFAPNHFDLITASPPCTEFSQAKTIGSRDVESAMELIEKTLEIISYFQPRRWWIETPRYGLLSKHPIMSPFSLWEVDYCQFSESGFETPTRLFRQ